MEQLIVGMTEKGGKMMVLDGRSLADSICKDLKDRVDVMKEDGVKPILKIISSGDDDASKVYVRNKIRRCEEIGIVPKVVHYSELTDGDICSACITTDPIIFQMPMTGDVSSKNVSRYLDPVCDVDGFASVENVSFLASGETPFFCPCTPAGVVRLLDHYNIPTNGRTVCIIGRSNIVGRPLARMMEQRGATVILCHSHTPEGVLYEMVGASDIVVSATGHRNTLEYGKMNKEKIHLQTFVDVGMNRDENGKLCGDIDPEIKRRSYAFTPVPGGVGPMTVAMLMENVVNFYEECTV